MIMRASFVEGIISMVRVRICSIGFLIAPLVGAMDDCFLIQQRDNQKSIWWRTAGSNSANCKQGHSSQSGGERLSASSSV